VLAGLVICFKIRDIISYFAVALHKKRQYIKSNCKTGV